MYRLINLIGHTWHPYFSVQRDDRMRTCFPENSNQKSQSKITFNQCNSEEGDEWKKLYHFRSRLWNHWIQKLKVTRQDLDIILRLNLLYLWEYLPFFLVSPGCCTLVCTPTGVYKKEGGPRSSHYFAFQKSIVDNIWVWRWKHYLYSYQDFNKKSQSSKCP